MAAEYLVNRVSHVAKSKVAQGSAHACDDGQHASKNRSGGLRRAGWHCASLWKRFDRFRTKWCLTKLTWFQIGEWFHVAFSIFIVKLFYHRYGVEFRTGNTCWRKWIGCLWVCGFQWRVEDRANFTRRPKNSQSRPHETFLMAWLAPPISHSSHGSHGVHGRHSNRVAMGADRWPAAVTAMVAASGRAGKASKVSLEQVGWGEKSQGMPQIWIHSALKSKPLCQSKIIRL